MIDVTESAEVDTAISSLVSGRASMFTADNDPMPVIEHHASVGKGLAATLPTMAHTSAQKEVEQSGVGHGVVQPYHVSRSLGSDFRSSATPSGVALVIRIVSSSRLVSPFRYARPASPTRFELSVMDRRWVNPATCTIPASVRREIGSWLAPET